MFTKCIRACLCGILIIMSGTGVSHADTTTGSLTADPPAKPGRLLSSDEVAYLNQYIFPNGDGLPNGSGDVASGKILYQQHCASCHGAAGEGGRAVELVGDRALLNTDYPDKGVGVVWPYAPTLYAYIERSMPPDNTQAFTADEYYALVAYVLHLNALLPEGAMLDKEALAGIKMPNVSNWRP